MTEDRDDPFADAVFDDGRGAYPDRVATGVPRGWRRELRRAACESGISVSELIRRALAASISSSGHREVRQ